MQLGSGRIVPAAAQTAPTIAPMGIEEEDSEEGVASATMGGEKGDVVESGGGSGDTAESGGASGESGGVGENASPSEDEDGEESVS